MGGDVDTLSLLAALAVADVVLPFAFGYWIGHPVLAALPFAALGVTVLIRQIQLGESPDGSAALLVGILVSTVISAAAAFAGGRIRERYSAGGM